MHYLKNKFVFTFIVFILISFIQFTVLQNVFSKFVMPNLMLIAIIIISIYFDYVLASIFSLFGGILIDSSNSLFFGSSTLVFLLIVLLIQLIKHFNTPNLIVVLFLIFAFTFLYDIFTNIFVDIFIINIDYINNLRLSLICSIENIIIAFLFLKIVNIKDIAKSYYA